MAKLFGGEREKGQGGDYKGAGLMLDQIQLNFIERSLKLVDQNWKLPLIEKKPDGGYRVTDYPISVESPNASLHIDASGRVTSGHDRQEVIRILKQVRLTLEKGSS